MILLIAAYLPQTALAEETPITFQYHTNPHQLVLTWPGATQVQHVVRGSDLIFTFNQAIRVNQPQQLPKQSAGAIENVRSGYDKLSLTLAEGISAHVQPISQGVVIGLEGRAQESLGTSLLKIRLMAQKGNETGALERLDVLGKQYPNNRDIAITRADILQQTGQWKSALSTYETLSGSEPNNEDLRAAQRAIQLDHSPFVDVNAEYRDTGDSRNEFFTRALGEARVSDNINIGLAVERDDAEVDTFFSPREHSIMRINDEFYRGEAYLTLEGPKGNTLKTSLFAGEQNIGGGVQYAIQDNKGLTLLGAEYNAPNWDFIETVVANGTRDRISLGRTQRVTPRFNLALQGGLNQYNLEGFDEAARSFSVEGSASYAIASEHHYADFLGKDATLNLRYTLDAEYPFDVKEATGIGGVFEPLPITSREVHSLVLAVGKRVAQPVLVEIYGGYAIDRLGDDGVKYGADIFADLTEKVEFRTGYQHSVSTEISSEALDSVTAGLRAKF